MQNVAFGSDDYSFFHSFSHLLDIHYPAPAWWGFAHAIDRARVEQFI